MHRSAPLAHLVLWPNASGHVPDLQKLSVTNPRARAHSHRPGNPPTNVRIRPAHPALFFARARMTHFSFEPRPSGSGMVHPLPDGRGSVKVSFTSAQRITRVCHATATVPLPPGSPPSNPSRRGSRHPTQFAGLDGGDPG